MIYFMSINIKFNVDHKLKECIINFNLFFYVYFN